MASPGVFYRFQHCGRLSFIRLDWFYNHEARSSGHEFVPHPVLVQCVADYAVRVHDHRSGNDCLPQRVHAVDALQYLQRYGSTHGQSVVALLHFQSVGLLGYHFHCRGEKVATTLIFARLPSHNDLSLLLVERPC